MGLHGPIAKPIGFLGGRRPLWRREVKTAPRSTKASRRPVGSKAPPLDATLVSVGPHPMSETIKYPAYAEATAIATLENLEQHPLALIFPPYEEADLVKLAHDIREHGLIEPITLYGVQVLDGWNRVQACKRAGLTEVWCRSFKGDDAQAQLFVYGKNMLRRQLTNDQRAGIAARFATMKSGTRTDLPPIGGRSPPGISVAEAAAQAKVSKRTVERAKSLDRRSAEGLACPLRLRHVFPRQAVRTAWLAITRDLCGKFKTVIVALTTKTGLSRRRVLREFDRALG
jgi:ParB-like nuclease domain